MLADGQMPASAHNDRVYHNKDIAGVNSDHWIGYVCDEEVDGHWVYAEFYLHDGSLEIEYGGGDANCDFVYPTSSYIDDVKICEETKGCREEWI